MEWTSEAKRKFQKNPLPVAWFVVKISEFVHGFVNLLLIFEISDPNVLLLERQLTPKTKNNGLKHEKKKKKKINVHRFAGIY